MTNIDCVVVHVNVFNVYVHICIYWIYKSTYIGITKQIAFCTKRIIYVACKQIDPLEEQTYSRQVYTNIVLSTHKTPLAAYRVQRDLNFPL